MELQAFLANKPDLEIKKLLGGNTYGKAYLMNNYKVVKETRDPNEALLAIRHAQASDKTGLTPMVNIYDVERIGDVFYITQEYAPPSDELKNTVKEMEMILNYLYMTKGKKSHLHYLSTGAMPEKEKARFGDIGKEIFELFKSVDTTLITKGSEPKNMDVKLEHVGYNNDIELVFFDLRDGSITEDEAMTIVNTLLPKPEPDLNLRIQHEEPEPSMAINRRR